METGTRKTKHAPRLQRPALAAVLAALDGVTDPHEAVEVLQTRGLWPMENPPCMWANFDATAIELIADLVAVASIGCETIATVSAVAEAYTHARLRVMRTPMEPPRVVWQTGPTKRSPARAESHRGRVQTLGLDLRWCFFASRAEVWVPYVEGLPHGRAKPVFA